ncbi:MAG: hypothetical protein DRP15_02520, partial [Candidatus Aenigmatarchaeota archaeon]
MGMRKAQVEFTLILALVFVMVVVIYYASRGSFIPSPIPSNVFEEQKIVQNSVINLIRKGVDETLRVMETHGGYLSSNTSKDIGFEEVSHVMFTGYEVPYWQKCNRLFIPSKKKVKKWMEISISEYIKNHISEAAHMQKVRFHLENLSVSANILRDKIEVTVHLPTSVNGYKMREPLYPYTVSIPTKFGEIYNFANDFSRESADKRFFETFTMLSLYFSKYTFDGHPKLPTMGLLTECGDTIYRTTNQISSYLMEIVEYILTHILWWQPMINQAGKPETKVFSIESVNGNKYADLNIRLYIPDDFVFNITNPILITNSNIIINKGSPFVVHDCLTAYVQTYSVVYP